MNGAMGGTSRESPGLPAAVLGLAAVQDHQVVAPADFSNQWLENFAVSIGERRSSAVILETLLAR